MSEITVTFSKSNVTAEWDNDYDSIVEFAEDQGVDIETGCRYGDCGTCMTAMKSGKVAYEYDPMATLDEGTILPCCCKPTESITIEA